MKLFASLKQQESCSVWQPFGLSAFCRHFVDASVKI